MADAKATKKAAMKTAKKTPLKALTRSRRRKLYELVTIERNVRWFDASWLATIERNVRAFDADVPS